MTRTPLVSIIIPTRNSAQFLDACLRSIKNQTYKNSEIIVVDNNSTDDTKKIARKYTKLVFNKGPERSAQRNFGTSKAKGNYYLFIDSDMELSQKVISECIKKIELRNPPVAIIIPEESVGEGFWAQCKALERSFYVGVDWMEGARFFSKKVFLEMKGYDENCVSGEDFDISQKVKLRFGNSSVSRTQERIFHNEGKLSLKKTLVKKYYYGSKIGNYKNRNAENYSKQANIFFRYKLYISNPKKLFNKPIIGLGMLCMKTAEFGAGGVGYILK